MTSHFPNESVIGDKSLLAHVELGFEKLPGAGRAGLSPEMKPFRREPLGINHGE
jgi:hypothetical protein